MQFSVKVERQEEVSPASRSLGLDVGIASFYTESEGNKVDNPRHLRRSEKALKRLQRRVSKKFLLGQPQSNNYKKAKKKLGRKHLKVTRQRKDFAVKSARCVVTSSEVVAYEDLSVANLAKNPRLAKSVSDAAWSQFTQYFQYFGECFGKIVIAVPPEYTSQDCFVCGTRVRKSLPVRTHQCPKCRTILDRHHNAAINILIKALRLVGIETTNTVGHTEFQAWGEETAFSSGESLKWKVASANQESNDSGYCLKSLECQVVRVLLYVSSSSLEPLKRWARLRE